MPKVITLISKKAEVGKTTSIVNLATWISFLGKSVLIIDTDPRNIAGNYLGGSLLRDSKNLKDVICDRYFIDQAIAQTPVKDLDIISNRLNDDDLATFLNHISENKYALRDAIDLLEKEYDYIFIDIPTNITEIVDSVLLASDSVIIPIIPTADLIDTIPDLLQKIREIKDYGNQWLQLDGILVTINDTANINTRKILMQLKSKFSSMMFKNSIPKNNQISQAMAAGKPVALFDIKSFGSEIFLSLAKEFIKKNELKI